MGRLLIPERWEGMPVVTADRMRALDRKAAARGIAVETLMENAGKAVAEEAAALLREAGKEPAQARVAVACGRGNNGGDGLVAARLLKDAGAAVSAFLVAARDDKPYPPGVRRSLERALEAGVEVASIDKDAAPLGAACAQADLVIDALLGTGATGKPAGAAHKMIQQITRSKKPVLAVDVPSGIDADTGYHSGVFVTAAVTVTLALPKRGLLATHAAKNVGKLKVADIGIPRDLWEGA